MDAKTLADALLRATAQQDAAKASVDAYREALTDRFRRLHTEEGIRGRVDLDGLGNARWDTPEPEPVITDPVAFMQWASDSCEVRITVSPVIADMIEGFLSDFTEAWKREEVLRDTDRDALLKSLSASDDGEAFTPHGEVVPGVQFREKAPRLVVTVDQSRKAEARQAAHAAVIAEVAGP